MGFGAIKAGRAYVELYSEDNRLVRGLATARRKLQAWGRGISRLFGIGGMLTMAGLFAGLMKAVQLAETQRKAEMKLAGTLRATGGAAGYTATELKAYAQQLQKVTNYSDELTINAMALLATFTQVKGEVFKDGIRLAQDMSAVMDQDLNQTIMQLGVALNDPIRGMTRLKRVGVSFTQAQIDQIKALQTAGDMMGAQRVILNELQAEFGGVAELLAEPMTQLKNALGDVAEKIGGELVPYLAIMSQSLIASFQGGAIQGEGLRRTLSTLADVFHVMWLGMKSVFWVLHTGMLIVMKALEKIMEGLAAVGAISKATAGDWEASFEKMRRSNIALSKSIQEGFVDPWPSEKAEQLRRFREERMKELEAKMKALGVAAEMQAAGTAVGAPRGLVAGTREMAAAEARRQIDEQLTELRKLNDTVEGIAETIEEAAGEDETATAEIFG